MTLNDLFLLGMKREIAELIPPHGEMINLGAGNSPIPGTRSLDLPAWDAETMPIPETDESIDTIFAFHFFEHFTGAQVIKILRECERVMKIGATLNIVVPHFLGMMAYQDLDHKSFWAETTFLKLFQNHYYEKNREVRWRLQPRVVVVMGIVSRNLALMAQLIKES